MKLHEDRNLFVDVLRATAQRYSIRVVYVEKDYWVTYSLKNVFTSDLQGKVVFKGGTSLSKVYCTIDRFSEDVDLALLSGEGRSASRTRKLLRDITNLAGTGLTEDASTICTDKHTKIRKVYYHYPRLADGDIVGQVGQRLLIEANAFSRPQPNKQDAIQSYVADFLKERREYSILEEYDLASFPVQVLLPEKTLAEKILSLIKASLQDQPVEPLRKKIRHIYDVHQLLQLDDIRSIVKSESFLRHLKSTLKDDMLSPVGNKDWISRPFMEAEIFGAPQKVWPELSSVYHADFKDMMFGPLPSQEQILKSLELVGAIVSEFDRNR